MRTHSALVAVVAAVALVAVGASLAAVETAPPAVGTVQVTGFAKVSIFGSSGPTSVTLTRQDAATAVETLDALPATSAPTCHEDAVIYGIDITRNGVTTIVTGVMCEQDVVVTGQGKKVDLSDRRCALLRIVQAVLPKEARGTRDATCAAAEHSTG